jgi:hypothetical protein
MAGSIMRTKTELTGERAWKSRDIGKVANLKAGNPMMIYRTTILTFRELLHYQNSDFLLIRV